MRGTIIAIIASLLLVGPGIGSAQPNSDPLTVLRQLVFDSQQANFRHNMAAEQCDRTAMQAEQRSLDQMAVEARQIADGASAAGQLSAVSPQIAENHARHVEEIASAARAREPRNCGQAAERDTQTTGGIAGGLGPGAAQQGAAGTPAAAESVLARLRREAIEANYRHAGAAERCDIEAMARELRIIAEIERRAQRSLQFARAGDALLSTESSRSAVRKAEEDLAEIWLIRETMIARPRSNCPKPSPAPFRIRIPQFPQQPQQEPQPPQQPQSERQQDPGARLFGRALEQVLSPPGSQDGKPALGFPPLLRSDRKSPRKDGAAPPPAPANPPRTPARERGRDYCDDGSPVNSEGNCEIGVQQPRGGEEHPPPVPPPPSRPERTTLEVIEESDGAIERQQRAGSAAETFRCNCPTGESECEAEKSCSNAESTDRGCSADIGARFDCPFEDIAQPERCTAGGAPDSQCNEENRAPSIPVQRTTLEEIEQSDSAGEKQPPPPAPPLPTPPPPP